MASHARAQVNYAKAADSLGVYYPNRGEFYLQDSDGSGVVKRVGITGVATSTLPFAGDWTGSGFDSIGLYDRATSTFYLKNDTSSSGSANLVVQFGWTPNSTAYPVAGDWTHKGYDSIGFYDSSTATFYLKNSNTGGTADLTLPVRTDSGAMPPIDAYPIVGDWSGNGISRVGFYSASQGTYYLRMTNNPGSQNCSSSGYGFGGSGQACVGLMGKWLATSTTSTQALFYPANNYFVGKYTLNIPPGYGDFSYVAPPQGRELATPVIPVVGKWQPSQSLSAGQNTSCASPAWMKDQIMYEMRIDTLTDSAAAGTNACTIKGATGLLPQLADLGVTGIVLDPIQANGQGGDIRTNNYYGNCVPGTLEPRLGTDADMAAFVTQAHSLGIMVFVDIVQHGIQTNSPYASGTTAYPYDYLSRNADGSVLVNYWGCYELDWTSQGLRDWWTNNIGIAWVNQYGIDGFRMDLEPAPASSTLWGQFKSQVLSSTGKQIILIPELSCGSRAYTYDTTQDDYMISGSTGTVTNNATGATGNIVDLIKVAPENFYTCGLSNHDSRAYGAKGKLSRFAYGMLLSPFIPRWFTGEEFNATPDLVLSGTDVPLYFSQIHWSQLSGSNAIFYNQVKQLVQIRKRFASVIEPNGGPLSSTNITKVTTYSGLDLPPYSMWSSGTSVTVLASNTSSGAVSVVVPLTQMGMTGYPYYEVTDMLSGSTSFPTQSTITGGLNFSIGQGGVIPLLVVGMNSAPVTATVTVSSGTISEVGGSTSFTVTRTGTSGAQTFYYTIGGSAVSGSDYVALSGSLTIPAGQTSGTLTLTALDNNIADGNRTAAFNLSYGQYIVGTPSGATVTILDNEQRYTWTNPSTSGTLSWSGSANWNGSFAAVSSSSSTLEFFTGQTLSSGTVTANNDIASPLQLNTLTLGGTGSTGAASGVTLTGGTLQMVSEMGYAPTVNLNAVNSGTAVSTYKLNNPLILSATTQFQGLGTATFNFAGSISGSGGIIKTGNSIMTLSASNNFLGGINLNWGTIIINSANNLPTGSNITVASGAQLYIQSNGAVSVGSMTLSGTGNGTGISGFGGALYLPTGSFSTSCPITLSGSNPVELTCYCGNGVMTFSGPISGNASLMLQSVGAASTHLGVWVMSGTSSYTGSTMLIATKSNGILKLSGGDNRLPTGTVLTLNSSYQFAPGDGGGWSYTKLDLNGCNQTLAGLISTGSGASSVINSGSLAATLSINATASSTFYGALGASGSGNNFSVIKSGTGTWTLSGTAASSYTGTTTVSAGTLALGGTLANSNTINVQNGAVLDVTAMSAGLTLGSGQLLTGAGTVSGSVTVTGTHQPGNGIEIGYFSGSLSYGPAAHLGWALISNTTSSPGISYDQVVSTGTVAGSSGAVIDLALNGAGSVTDFTDCFWTQSQSWTVIAGASVSGIFACGTVSADSNGRQTSGYGSFSILTSSTSVKVLWTPSPINAWRAWFGSDTTNPAIAGDKATPAHDGIANLVKYALGLNKPTVPAKSGLPVVSQAGGYLMLTYTKVKSATDIVYQPVWSNDLSSWASTGISEDVLLDSGTTQKVCDKVPITTETRKFIRLQIVRP